MAGMPSAEHCKKLRVGIVAAEWNDNIISPLLQGAIDTLTENGVCPENIFVSRVPGTVELTYGAKRMIDSLSPDAVIVLGCVVRGDTPHFDYVCDSVTQGVTELNLRERVPVIFGVITTNNMEQALDRAGGKVGNKGSECAATALKMTALKATALNGEEISLL
ncbi:MAG: 6,7-dimethyl-8-ribityllumazine synthase [Bacteroidaceae bacterium]|nr:6,7-dimethyl-8-ribityllumazine synthase [Bacteroidaceae bacterium]